MENIASRIRNGFGRSSETMKKNSTPPSKQSSAELLACSSTESLRQSSAHSPMHSPTPSQTSAQSPMHSQSSMHSSVQSSMQSYKEESEPFKENKEKLATAFSWIKYGCPETTVQACKEIHMSAGAADIKMTKDQLFDFALEVSLTGNNKIAIDILMIADSPNDGKLVPVPGQPYHPEAYACWNTLSSSSEFGGLHYEVEKFLIKAIAEKEHLKCAPYFLAKAYETGAFGITKSQEKAREYIEIADKRGYESNDSGRFLSFAYGEGTKKATRLRVSVTSEQSVSDKNGQTEQLVSDKKSRGAKK